MVGPEASSGAGWIEGFGAFLLLILTLGGQAWRYIRESNKEDSASKHVILEQGQLADMAPMRDLTKQIAQVYPLLTDIDEKSEEMLELLRSMDRDRQIAKGVEERLRDERMKADREARDRGTR